VSEAYCTSKILDNVAKNDGQVIEKQGKERADMETYIQNRYADYFPEKASLGKNVYAELLITSFEHSAVKTTSTCVCSRLQQHTCCV
jgi:hypothetical protein